MKYLTAIWTTTALTVFCLQLNALAEDTNQSNVTVLTNIEYKAGSNLTDYEKERCKLDLYLPSGQTNFATLVWFHGGGLKEGGKYFGVALGRAFAKAGVAVVSANYRLSPKVKYPAYVEDAAAVFAWTRTHIAEHGGNPKTIFIGGHSAGGWLAMMVGLDEHYLRTFGMDLSSVAGLVPVSGQTVTHFTVREERGIGQFTITADDAAPVYYARKWTPPMLVLYADHDMVARAEENEYFVALMKGAGNEHVTGQLIHDRTHNTIANRLADKGDSAQLAILEFIKSESKMRLSTLSTKSGSR